MARGQYKRYSLLDEKTGLKLTTARYFTPSGRSIQAKGIVPDIPVEALEFVNKDTKNEDKVAPLSEADLSGHISNPNGDKKSLRYKSRKKLRE